jgi:hypothetical protein
MRQYKDKIDMKGGWDCVATNTKQKMTSVCDSYDPFEVIIATKTELYELTSLMEFVLGEWRYDTMRDAMSMRTRLAARWQTVHESFHPVLDHTWDLLRRLMNMYHRVGGPF